MKKNVKRNSKLVNLQDVVHVVTTKAAVSLVVVVVVTTSAADAATTAMTTAAAIQKTKSRSLVREGE